MLEKEIDIVRLLKEMRYTRIFRQNRLQQIPRDERNELKKRIENNLYRVVSAEYSNSSSSDSLESKHNSSMTLERDNPENTVRKQGMLSAQYDTNEHVRSHFSDDMNHESINIDPKQYASNPTQDKNTGRLLADINSRFVRPLNENGKLVLPHQTGFTRTQMIQSE